MRLNYSVHFEYIGELVSSRILFRVLSNYVGTPKFRIYLDGDPAPAFANCNLLFGNEVSGVAAGLYRVEYTDDNGDRLISKVRIYDFASSCWDKNNVLYDEQGFNATMIRTDSGLSFSSTVRRVLSSNPAHNVNTNRSVSIDGGTTFKSVVNPNSGGTAEWTDEEIESLVAGSTLTEVHIRRDTIGTHFGCTTVPFEEFLLDWIEPLEVDHTSTNCTAIGADDGTITVTVDGGSGNYSFLWNDGAVTQNRSNLAPGVYSVTITDTVTLEEVEIEDIEITEPAFVPQVGTTLEVPPLNSLTFVVDPIVPDGISSFQTPDNTLFADQVFPRMSGGKYYQKVCIADDRIVQFYSDFPYHHIGLYDCEDNLIKSFAVELKENNIGRIEDFNITIKNHTDNPGKSRVYFNTGDIPIPLSVGDVFEIINNLEGFDGSYSIIAIEEDELLGYDYIVITKNYDAAVTSTAATGRFRSSPVNFNVFESTLIFSDIPEGYYYAKITATDDLDNTKIAESEPISVKTVHPNTNLVSYRCEDNCFNMTWTTGYIGRKRVESSLFKRNTGGERSTSRNSDFSLSKVNAKKVRVFTFETLMLPPYLHEQLGLIFDCDFISINGLQVQTNESYPEATYPEYFMLGSSSIQVEQVGWLDRYNTHDIGSVADGGFLITEQGFVKL